MVEVVTDLHLHSKYSRAVSPQMVLPTMAEKALQKGIDILATGDFTHPLWMRELSSQLMESEEGLFRIKNNGLKSGGSLPRGEQENKSPRFLLSVEIATMFSQKGKGRRIHQLIFVPSLTIAEKLNKELIKRGYSLAADGRPIISLSSKNLLSLLLEIDERSLLIPAHIWTPWFGIYGQRSGFESLEDAFEDMAPFVYGIETGLSSDPEMNWQIKELETRSILSFSDAHSLPKVGREATVFELERVSYENIRQAIMRPSRKNQSTTDKVVYTIEFYPEEGKYHYSGHRNCKVYQTPDEQRALQSICPVCKRKVTDGVLRRVEELSSERPRGLHKIEKQHIMWIEDRKRVHPPFVKIVPLQEIIAEAVGSSFTSKKVEHIFLALCSTLPEFSVLLSMSSKEIVSALHAITTPAIAKRIAEGIERVREESIAITPGYDGLYGKVRIWDNMTETKQKSIQDTLDI